MILRTVISGIILINLGQLQSQNLVNNPSFEQYISCPRLLGTFDTDVTGWSAPTLGSTDYFNACSSSMGTPENFNGAQRADFGQGYTGLYLYAPNDYREYIQGSLQKSLQAGMVYRLDLYVSLAERSDFAVSSMDVAFARNAVQLPIKKELSRMQFYRSGDNEFNFLTLTKGDYLEDKTNWVHLSLEFEARGYERFILLGNFNDNTGTRLRKLKKNAKQGAYYYLDMLSLVPADMPASVEWEGEPALNTLHVFKDVLFRFDGTELGQAAKKEIRKVHEYLLADSSLKITLSGHTDNVGTAAYNLDLARKRCSSVANYLLALGLPKERVSWVAHGGEQPIADNSSEDGRQRNRRVEFVITRS